MQITSCWNDNLAFQSPAMLVTMVSRLILGWLDSSIRRRKRACNDVTASQLMAVLRCCVWLLAEMRSSRSVFGLHNRKSGVNRHLRFCQFSKNSEVCRVGYVSFIKPWHHTLHISELKYAPTYFYNYLNNCKIIILQLFKSNTARDERISANSQTQHWRTAIFWLAVTSSHALFLCRIEESCQPSIVL